VQPDRVSKGRRVVRSVIAIFGEGCIKMREIEDAGVELGHRQALIASRYRQEIQRFIVALGTTLLSSGFANDSGLEIFKSPHARDVGLEGHCKAWRREQAANAVQVRRAKMTEEPIAVASVLDRLR